MAAKVFDPLPISVIEEICARFKLKHLSHSNLDLARNDLALWVLRYLYKVYDPGNAAISAALRSKFPAFQSPAWAIPILILPRLSLI